MRLKGRRKVKPPLLALAMAAPCPAAGSAGAPGHKLGGVKTLVWPPAETAVFWSPAHQLTSPYPNPLPLFVFLTKS